MYIKKILTDDDGVILKTKDSKFTVFDNDKGYLFRSNAKFVKSYIDIKLSDVLTSKSDIANLFILAENMYQNTNLICYRKNKKYFAADVKDISRILNMSHRRVREFVERMMSKSLIAKAIINTEERIEVQYYVNPLYFHSSKYISPFLYMLFRKQLDKHLPAWVVKKFHDYTN